MLVPIIISIIRIMILQMITNRYECIRILPKLTNACMIHYTCVYIRAGWGLLRLGTLSRGLGAGSPGPTPQKPPARSNIHTCIVYHACAGPFWRMRQSILANAPIYFGEFLILSNVFMHQDAVFNFFSGRPMQTLCYNTYKIEFAMC